MARSQFMAKQFVNHVHKFMDSMQLRDPNKSAIVAVSGGVDSIALMYALKDIMKGQVRVLHINHGTRNENAVEEQLVLDHCQRLGLEVDVVRFTLKLNQNNFEAVARNLRAKVYKQYIQKNYWVYTAHHLDDSFEWSMIQSFRQSTLKSTLGIPVFNRGLVRPFMCVSKDHIRKYARALNLSWAEDGSNRDMRFERNFFRRALTQTIRKRYPQYLRHYMARQTELALKLGVHRSLFLNEKAGEKPRLIEKREASGAVVLKSSDFSFHKDQIKEWIHFFSKTHRGEIDREVDKLILAHKSIKENSKEVKMKGPLSFSGGVKIFVLDDYLLIANQLHLAYYQECDELLLRYLMNATDITQITKGRVKDSKKIFFPYLLFLHERDKEKKTKLTHPLLPRSTEWLKVHKIPYSFYPLLSKKNKQKLHHGAVILDSSILGL
ncbi:MAG: tRNA lysidine(34) synthetase TilS [Bacteriovorax sp.]